MDSGTGHYVETLDELVALYDAPNARVIAKEIDHVDAAGRAFIAAAPFLILATSTEDGADCSPKGDAPGFVAVLDEKTLLIPDRRGNNRIDGLRNIVRNPQVGLIFMVPGVDETYRVNGRARISTDPALLARFVVDGKPPRTVIVVHVEQAFPHCPKALVRSKLWKSAARPRPTEVPTIGAFAAARDTSLDPAAYDIEYARRVPDELY